MSDSNKSEIEYLKGRIADNKERIRKLEEEEQNREFSEKLHSIFSNLIVAGFSVDQAFQILMSILKKST